MTDQLAFPGSGGSISEKGMTLRDYFAAKAMQAMVPHVNRSQQTWRVDMAAEAYTIADAMLDARR